MYQAVVIPYGVPEEWVLNVLFGDTDEERLMEIASQLLELGVRSFTITHYSPIKDTGVMIAIEDICLN